MEFRLLGLVEVLEDGRRLRTGGPRQRVLLTHLLLARGVVVPSDRLLELVWGPDAPTGVRASLHTYVSRLRATLGAGRLESRSAGYVLHADDGEVDAARFERTLASAGALATTDLEAAAVAYGEALALWAGPALGDLADEPSLSAEAARLEALRRRAVEERARVRLAAGHHRAVVPDLAALVQQDELREDLWCDYALALYRSGRPSDALAACGRARRVLRDELGVEPSRALRRLHEQLLRHDPALELGGPALRGYRLLDVLGEGASAVVHRAVQPGVGREVALKALRSTLADDADVVQRFAAEAQAAANIEHPHVVPLYDWWREPGGAFLVLRLLRGGTLADRLAREPVALDEVVPWVHQLAGALDACAREGILHSRLEAGDVLLDADGNAYLSAFLLPRSGTRGRRTTDAGAPAGDPLRVGRDGSPDRPDVLALGRLVRQLVSGGRRPSAVDDVVARAAGQVPGAHCGDALQVAAALSRAARTTTPAAGPQGSSPPAPRRNPYKGLRPFTEADADDFFGRTALVDRLVDRLRAQRDRADPRLLAVVGPSGCGKSSVVRAGLVPALLAGAVADVDRWFVAELQPGAAPLAELSTALSRVLVAPLPAAGAGALCDDPTSLLRAAQELLPGAGAVRCALLVVVDQFEELYTLTPDTERRDFLDRLVRAATAVGAAAHVVVTLRADFYDRPLADPALAGLLASGTEVVVPLSAEELEQAVVEPANRAGLQVEPALLAQVVADVADAPAALPLLQYALTELVERTAGRTLLLAGYREVGGVAGALVRRADSVHAAFDPQQQRVSQEVLLQLVQPGEDGADTRRRVLLQELVQRTEDPDTAETVTAALGAARLLAFDRDAASRAPTVQIAHEALLREWSLLRGWVDAARDDLHTQRRLAAAAQEWDDSGRDSSFLPGGSRLEALEELTGRWSTSQGWAPSAVERDYLAHSSRARTAAKEAEGARRDHELRLERRSVRRLRAVAVVLAVGVVLAGVLTAFGFTQQSEAQRQSRLADGRALAAAALAGLDEDPELSVLLALQAVRFGREDGNRALPEAGNALHRATTGHRLVRRLEGVGGSVDWSDRGLVVGEGPEGSGLIDFRDDATGERVRAFRGHQVDVNEVAFSPDGTRLLTTGDDGAARLWDVSDGRLLWQLRTAGEVRGPAFSADGRRLSAAWRDEGSARVVEIATGRVVADLRSVQRPTATALTADGSRLVLAGQREPGAVVQDVSTSEVVLRLGGGRWPVFDVDVSPDGRWIATSALDGRVRLWSARDGRGSATLHTGAAAVALDWSSDSTRVVVAGNDGTARLFAVEDGGVRDVLSMPAPDLRGLTGAAFSPDGTRVLLGDSALPAAQVWDVSVGGSREWVTLPGPVGEPVAADFAGPHVVASAVDGTVGVWSSTGELVRSTRSYAGTVAGVRASSDGQLVAGAVAGAVRVWSVTTGAELFAVPTQDGVVDLSWSGDGQLLARAGPGGLHLVDRSGAAATGLPSGAGADVTAVDLTDDGTVLVTAHRPTGPAPDAVVRVTERRTGWRLRSWPVAAEAVAVDPAGRAVAWASATGAVEVRDIASGSRLHALTGHRVPVVALAFSPDSASLATAGLGGSVRLWDVRTGAQQLVLDAHEAAVHSIRFSRDGRRLVSASADGTVRVWALELDDLIALAEARLTRGLSVEECQTYLPREPCR